MDLERVGVQVAQRAPDEQPPLVLEPRFVVGGARVVSEWGWGLLGDDESVHLFSSEGGHIINFQIFDFVFFECSSDADITDFVVFDLVNEL